jgi:hypothetical protein
MDNREIAQGCEMHCYACESTNVIVTADGPNSFIVDCMDCGSDRKEDLGVTVLTSKEKDTSGLILPRNIAPMNSPMFIADKYSEMAEDYKSLASMTDNLSEIAKFRKLQKSAEDMAENEAWLNENYENTLHSNDSVQDNGPAFAAEEEHVLRCLGAALLMQWPRLPATIQRELFDSAGALGELQNTALLRGQIARFLHRHKDDASPTSDLAGSA